MEEIEKMVRQAITRHLVQHVQVENDRRDRVDILCEEAAAAIQAHYAVLLAEKDKRIVELEGEERALRKEVTMKRKIISWVSIGVPYHRALEYAKQDDDEQANQ